MANPSKSKSTDVIQQSNGGKRGSLMPTRSPYLSSHLTPWGPLGRLRTEFDRMFDDFFQGVPAMWSGQRELGMGIDVRETDDAIVVQADAPGFDADEFDVEIRGDNLIVCACQSEEKTQDEEGYHWQKRELYRSVPLPAEVDAEKIDAKYHNGVLSIKLPKAEQAKSRKIEVKT